MVSIFEGITVNINVENNLSSQSNVFHPQQDLAHQASYGQLDND